MNIYPHPSVAASSIAGTDRAANVNTAAASRTEAVTSNTSRTETVDSIDKGNGSEDSGADGRQTLDTFERRHQDDADSEEPQNAPAAPQVSTPRPGSQLDFKA